MNRVEKSDIKMFNTVLMCWANVFMTILFLESIIILSLFRIYNYFDVIFYRI